MKFGGKPPSVTNIPFAIVSTVLAIASLVFAGRISSARSIMQWVNLSGLPAFAFLITSGVYPAFQGAKEAASRSSCQSAINELGKAMLMYMGDSDGRLPPAGEWRTLVEQKYVTPGLRCPEAKSPWT